MDIVIQFLSPTNRNPTGDLAARVQWGDSFRILNEWWSIVNMPISRLAY